MGSEIQKKAVTVMGNDPPQIDLPVRPLTFCRFFIYSDSVAKM